MLYALKRKRGNMRIGVKIMYSECVATVTDICLSYLNMYAHRKNHSVCLHSYYNSVYIWS